MNDPAMNDPDYYYSRFCVRQLRAALQELQSVVPNARELDPTLLKHTQSAVQALTAGLHRACQIFEQHNIARYKITDEPADDFRPLDLVSKGEQ